MKYVVVSPRVGTPGEIYNPDVVVNIAALLAGGFIAKILDTAEPEETVEEPAPTPVKSAKNNSKKASTEE